MRNPKVLLASAIFLGVLPAILRALEVLPSFLLGFSVFALNIVVCLLGAASQYRLWWLTYAAACVAVFLLFGMSSPVSLAVRMLAGLTDGFSATGCSYWRMAKDIITPSLPCL